MKIIWIGLFNYIFPSYTFWKKAENAMPWHVEHYGFFNKKKFVRSKGCDKSSENHTCQVGKVQKREISLFASWERGRFCAKPFRDINFVYQHSNSGWNFENDETLPPYNGLKLIIWCITFYCCTLWILCWLSNAFSLQTSVQIILF